MNENVDMNANVEQLRIKFQFYFTFAILYICRS